MLNLQILGSGAATPTLNRGVTAQYLNFNERKILIDCGEGTQLQLRKFKVKFQRIQFMFISHLHGDHYLGLFGLLSSMHLLGRKTKIHIYAPPELEEIMELQFRLTYVKLNFEVIFHAVEVKEKTLMFEDKSIEIFAFPLKHRIKCYGYLLKEKVKDRSIIKEMVEEYKLLIPEIIKLKNGEDVERDNGLLKNEDFTLNPPKQQSYAFCTDTKYIESLKDVINNVDILYHEATFAHDMLDRAKATYHTTGVQAATLAKNANVKKLILGHFSQRYGDTSEIEQEAKAIFENTTCVRDGDVFLLK